MSNFKSLWFESHDLTKPEANAQLIRPSYLVLIVGYGMDGGGEGGWCSGWTIGRVMGMTLGWHRVNVDVEGFFSLLLASFMVFKSTQP